MKRGTPDHPKTLWLQSGLGCSRHEVVGLLEVLFHFIARCSPQGDIGKWSNRQIADGIGYRGDADELVAHLVGSGYFDEDRKHRLLVHDWPEHADNTVKKYLKRNNLEFCKPSGRVRTKDGHGPPKDGQGLPAVAVAITITKPSHNQTDISPQTAAAALVPTGHEPAWKGPEYEVFDYWRHRCGKERAEWTAARKRILAVRLREEPTGVEGLKLAVDGALADPWFNGAERDGKQLWDFDNVFVNKGRNRIEKLQESARNPPRPTVQRPNGKIRDKAEALDDYGTRLTEEALAAGIKPLVPLQKRLAGGES